VDLAEFKIKMFWVTPLKNVKAVKVAVENVKVKVEVKVEVLKSRKGHKEGHEEGHVVLDLNT